MIIETKDHRILSKAPERSLSIASLKNFGDFIMIFQPKFTGQQATRETLWFMAYETRTTSQTGSNPPNLLAFEIWISSDLRFLQDAHGKCNLHHHCIKNWKEHTSRHLKENAIHRTIWIWTRTRILFPVGFCSLRKRQREKRCEFTQRLLSRPLFECATESGISRMWNTKKFSSGIMITRPAR